MNNLMMQGQAFLPSWYCYNSIIKIVGEVWLIALCDDLELSGHYALEEE
jgi:hypothetical protein